MFAANGMSVLFENVNNLLKYATKINGSKRKKSLFMILIIIIYSFIVFHISVS